MPVEGLFQGTWKVGRCISKIPSSDGAVLPKIDGVVFVLQDNGEILWILPPEVDKGFPLFQCDCYEVVKAFDGMWYIQMGAVSGHMFEFEVKRPTPPSNEMELKFEGWCEIQCEQTGPIQPPLDFPFSFLPAFTEGYFSDIKLPFAEVSSLTGQPEGLPSSEAKEFKLHSIILQLSNLDPKEITKIPSDVLEVILHYNYSQSLPSTLSTETARRCIQLAPSSMSVFIQVCKDYVHRTTLKYKIIKLVNEVHSCAEVMASVFREHSVTSPSRFCYVIKLALRDAVVAFMKLVELCVLYGEEAPILNRNERLEILRYAKTRLPIFLTQFVALLRNVKNDFATVKPSDRNDIAAHVAPEIETLLEALSNLMREARDSCNNIWTRWSAQPATGSAPHGPTWPTGTNVSGEPMDILTEALYQIFRKREIVKLHHVQGQVVAIYWYLAQKKENFEEMTTPVKIRCVSRNLEQLLEELPVFLLRLEEVMIAFDDRFQWKDFKFCLQLAISQVCQTVQHLRREKDMLQKFFTCLSELVQRDEFHQSLINLGLLEVPTDASSSSSHEASPSDSGISSTLGSTSSHSNSPSKPVLNPQSSTGTKPSSIGNEFQASFKNSNLRFQMHFAISELNLMENLCTPKKSKDSILAKNSIKLFNSKQQSDMVFEISQDGELLEIPAHRVIVAARCDWFRRALLSGMKESIQKRIVIHDSSIQVFQLFLRFVYTGQISPDVSLETLTELFALADRYEMDMLKLYCEHELSLRHLDESSVFFLLSLADQYSAVTLRRATIDYISHNPTIVGKEMFEELSPELQMEVYDIAMWSKKPKNVFSIPDDELRGMRRPIFEASNPPSEEEESSSGSSSPTSDWGMSRHLHHHTHSHSHALIDDTTHSTGDSGFPFTDSSVQRAIVNSLAEHTARQRLLAGTRSEAQRDSSPNIPQHQEHQENQSNEERALSASFEQSHDRDNHQCSTTTQEGSSSRSSRREIEAENRALQTCMNQLKDILGEEVSDEQLRRIAIAADLDANRAVNFFLNSLQR